MAPHLFLGRSCLSLVDFVTQCHCIIVALGLIYTTIEAKAQGNFVFLVPCSELHVVGSVYFTHLIFADFDIYIVT